MFSLFQICSLAQVEAHVPTQKLSYLSIAVSYEYRCQYLHITEGANIIRQVVVLPADAYRQIERHKRVGYEVITLPAIMFFDNRPLFQIIDEYQTKGWTLHSQTMGLSRSETESTTNVERIQYFLFTKPD